MPRIVKDKANLFKQLSIYANNALEQLTKLQGSFTAKLAEITSATLAIADAAIEHNNKLQALTAKQIQAIAADVKTDINELKTRLIACYESYSNQITEFMLDTTAPASITNNLQCNLDEGLTAAADLMCRTLNQFTQIQHDANQQQAASLLELLRLKSEIKIKLDRLKTSLKQQVATAILQILQTKNKFHYQLLEPQATSEVINDLLVELEQQLQRIIVQVSQKYQQLISDAEQLVDMDTFSTKGLRIDIKHAQAKAHEINQHIIGLEQCYSSLLKIELQPKLKLLKQQNLAANNAVSDRATNALLFSSAVNKQDITSDVPPLEHSAIDSKPGF